MSSRSPRCPSRKLKDEHGDHFPLRRQLLRTNLDEAPAEVELQRGSVLRLDVHLASKHVDPRITGVSFDVRVKRGANPRASQIWSHDDSIDVDEAGVALAKPEKIHIFVAGAFTE